MINNRCQSPKHTERLELAAKRYEILRKLNVQQCKELFQENLTSGTPFDDLVDKIGESFNAGNV